MTSTSTGPPGPLIWTLPEPSPRPVTSLSRTAILRAALSIADVEGTEALTMRRISTKLGSSTPMSLYRYVGSKDGVIDLMLDAVYGEVELPERPSGDWRTDLESLARRTWAVIRGHLWFAELVHTRPLFGPNALRYFDFRFAALEPLGLGSDGMSRVTAAVDGHLIGSALQLVEENRMRRRTGLATEKQLKTAAEPLLAPIAEAGEYPAFSRWSRGLTGTDHTAFDLANDNVEWTLGCLLDGIAAKLSPQPGNQP
ncbi:MAG: TetR/AcrR family transcriptional regulator C-terminal domain-containing protein [Kutzneria sp.]|nr:TetR/AcrR family transcriptional regulator C-terminal domain-containing protein [Kutzneria sp.]MBV9843848.1 TetR/AcrR family transcriptional regulator C-terminal domain-containing protein [Kutzneria sp.]